MLAKLKQAAAARKRGKKSSSDSNKEELKDGKSEKKVKVEDEGAARESSTRISNVPGDPVARLKMKIPDTMTVSFDKDGAYLSPIVRHVASYDKEVKRRLTDEEIEEIKEARWKALPWWKRLRAKKEIVSQDLPKVKFVRIKEKTYLAENSTCIYDYDPFEYSNLGTVIPMKKNVIGIRRFAAPYHVGLSASMDEETYLTFLSGLNTTLFKFYVASLRRLVLFAVLILASVAGVLSGFSLAGIASLWFDPLIAHSSNSTTANSTLIPPPAVDANATIALNCSTTGNATNATWVNGTMACPSSIDMGEVLPWLCIIGSGLCFLATLAWFVVATKSAARRQKFLLQCILDRRASEMNKRVFTGHFERRYKWKLAFMPFLSKSSPKVYASGMFEEGEKNGGALENFQRYNCIRITMPDFTEQFRPPSPLDETLESEQVDFATKSKGEEKICSRCEGISEYVVGLGLSTWTEKLCHVARLNDEPGLLERQLKEDAEREKWEDEQDERELDAERQERERRIKGLPSLASLPSNSESEPPAFGTIFAGGADACSVCGSRLVKSKTEN